MVNNIAFTPQIAKKQLVPFKANEQLPVTEENTQKSKDNSNLLYGSLAVLGAFSLGMILKKPKVVQKVVEKEKVIEKSVEFDENRIFTRTKNKKQRIKNTTPNRNPRQATLEEQSRTINNIEFQNANSNSRKLLEEAINDTPTKAEIEAARPRYEAPNQQQKNDIANLHSKNKQERKELNSIGNQTGVAIKPNPQAAAIKKGIYNHANGNQYEINNGRVVKILDRNTQKGKVVEITDEKKIAKHMAKHNVELSDLTPVKNTAKKSKKVA